MALEKVQDGRADELARDLAQIFLKAQMDGLAPDICASIGVTVSAHLMRAVYGKPAARRLRNVITETTNLELPHIDWVVQPPAERKPS